ncbi:glycosyltransferase [Nocardioides ferulae]|uniref:glycosyltransferase n=1 Tax=Nocardioides ferulae TaxID=2340821 RepID=UPI000EB57DAD|nr:glycosyltransferase [Nocardioides ferulae]
MTDGAIPMLTPKQLSIVILARNSATDLRELASQLPPNCDVVLVDDDSDDDGVNVAIESGWRVVPAPVGVGFDKKRHAGVEAARGEWVLMLDSDERPTAAFWREVSLAVTQTNYSAYTVRFNTYFAGTQIRFAGVGDLLVVRMFRRDDYRGFLGSIHERVQFDGELGSIHAPLEHHSYRSTEHYITKINAYTSREAEELAACARRTFLPPAGALLGDFAYIAQCWMKTRDRTLVRAEAKQRLKNRYVVLSFLPAYPIGRFLNLYLFKQGFRDGSAGLKYGLLSMIYSAIKYIKYFEMKRGLR